MYFLSSNDAYHLSVNFKNASVVELCLRKPYLTSKNILYRSKKLYNVVLISISKRLPIDGRVEMVNTFIFTSSFEPVLEIVITPAIFKDNIVLLFHTNSFHNFAGCDENISKANLIACEGIMLRGPLEMLFFFSTNLSEICYNFYFFLIIFFS